MFSIVVTKPDSTTSVLEAKDLTEAKGLARGYQNPASATRVEVKDFGWTTVYTWGVSELEEWCVIGYNTNDLNLPLFKVNDFKRLGVKAIQDQIASDQAMRYPHIIYTVVRKSDLWW